MATAERCDNRMADEWNVAATATYESTAGYSVVGAGNFGQGQADDLLWLRQSDGAPVTWMFHSLNLRIGSSFNIHFWLFHFWLFHFWLLLTIKRLALAVKGPITSSARPITILKYHAPAVDRILMVGDCSRVDEQTCSAASSCDHVFRPICPRGNWQFFRAQPEEGEAKTTSD